MCKPNSKVFSIMLFSSLSLRLYLNWLVSNWISRIFRHNSYSEMLIFSLFQVLFQPFVELMEYIHVLWNIANNINLDTICFEPKIWNRHSHWEAGTHFTGTVFMANVLLVKSTGEQKRCWMPREHSNDQAWNEWYCLAEKRLTIQVFRMELPSWWTALRRQWSRTKVVWKNDKNDVGYFRVHGKCTILHGQGSNTSVLY